MTDPKEVVNEDYVMGTFNKAVKTFVVLLQIAETECENLIDSMSAITDLKDLHRIKAFHEARLGMIKTLRVGMERCTLPTFEQWLEIYEGPVKIPLEDLSIKKEDIEALLKDQEEKKDG